MFQNKVSLCLNNKVSAKGVRKKSSYLNNLNKQNSILKQEKYQSCLIPLADFFFWKMQVLSRQVNASKRKHKNV